MTPGPQAAPRGECRPPTLPEGSQRLAVMLPTRFGPLLVVVDPTGVADRARGLPGAVVLSRLVQRPQSAACAEGPQRNSSTGAGHESGTWPDILEQSMLPGSQHPLLVAVAAAVADWDGGVDLNALDRVPVEINGQGFHQRVRGVLREVPAGQTVSYRELAALAGNPQAMRAAGTACARNPLAPFVPCHRVVRSDGSLGQYAYDPAVKAAMLAHEGARL